MYFHAITYSAFRLSGVFVLGYAKSLSFVFCVRGLPRGGVKLVRASMVSNIIFVAGHHARWHESSRWQRHSLHMSVGLSAHLFLVPISFYNG